MPRSVGFLLVSLGLVSSANAGDHPVFQVSGYFKVDVIHSTSDTFTGNVLFYALPEPEGREDDDQFELTLNQTRLGLKFEGPPAGSAKTTGEVHVDFYGGGAENTPQARLYNGFVTFEWPAFSLRVGQDWDTHSALYPTTTNFGYLSAAGNTMYRRPQIRGTRTFEISETSRVSFASALARTIATDLDGNGKNDGDDAGGPTLEARLAFQRKTSAAPPLVIAFSGHYGEEEMDWDAAGTDVKIDSWSIVGEVQVPICTKASIKGEIFSGANLDAYFGGILQGVNRETRAAIRANGGWAEATMGPFNGYTFHFGGGVDRPNRKDLNVGDRLENRAIFANFFRRLSANATAAFEYTNTRTRYLGGPDGDDNRVQASCIYAF